MARVRRYGRGSPAKPPGRLRGSWFNVGPHAPSSADLSRPDQTRSEKLSRGKCSTQKKASLRAARPHGPMQRQLDVASARRLKGPHPPAPAAALPRVAANDSAAPRRISRCRSCPASLCCPPQGDVFRWTAPSLYSNRARTLCRASRSTLLTSSKRVSGRLLKPVRRPSSKSRPRVTSSIAKRTS